jgi:anti-repressor protein
MTAVQVVPFQFGQQTIRTVTVDGVLWFVAADVAGALGYSTTAAMTRSLDDDEKGVQNLHTPGGEQAMSVVTEAGAYTLAMRSQIEQAKKFRRWLAHDVVPSINRTGSYSVQPELAGAELLARAVLEAQSMLAAKDERIAELEPRAEVADRLLLSAEGDLSVADTAKILTRAGVKTGQARLFQQLALMAWTYRGRADGRWRVYGRVIEQGLMSVLPSSHYHPKTGELVEDVPQPRVTPKGLQKLLAAMTSTDMQVAS